MTMTQTVTVNMAPSGIAIPNFYRAMKKADFREWFRDARLTRKYEREIRGWDWATIKSQAESFVDWENGGYVSSCLLGSVFSVMPSGKYWLAWAKSNVTEEEQRKDSLFREAMDTVATEQGGWITNGEGDPCDLFFQFETPEDRRPIQCDQCQMLGINGVPCHETGCPNMGKRWNAEEAAWEAPESEQEWSEEDREFIDYDPAED